MYETTGEQSLLVEIPDVAVQRSVRDSNAEMSNVAIVEPPAQPIKVTVPVPETVRQGYLEIREVTTKEVVTVIELSLLSISALEKDGKLMRINESEY